MRTAVVELQNVPGTEAALGWTGSHTIVVDRPEGRAGGMGLGFNGAQLLGLSLGGCFCNDLRYKAHEAGVRLGKISVTVTVMLEGDPVLTTGARLNVICETETGEPATDIIERSIAACMTANSYRRGFPVEFVT